MVPNEPFITNVKLAWDELELGPQRRRTNVPKRHRDIQAIDTETIGGRLWLLGCSNGDSIFAESFYDVLSFFAECGLYRTINFCYNLDYDTRAILTLLPRGPLEELQSCGRVDIEGGFLKYIPHKIFSAHYKKHAYDFFDLAQFFYAKLGKASQRYLGITKLDLDSERIATDPSYREDRRYDIIRYCVRDASLTALLGEYTRKTFADIGCKTNRWYSAGYLSEAYFKQNGTVPRWHLNSAEEYAYYSYAGGRFEVFKRGHFDELYKYDLKSAYPYVIASLPDTDNAKWVLRDTIDYEADLIFAKCRVTTKRGYVEPYHYRVGSVVAYPIARPHIRILTKSELELARDFDISEIEVLDAWHLYANTDVKPFAKIRDLYALRSDWKSKKDSREWVLKIVMNSLYGKFIQVTPRIDTELHYSTGNLFLPSYASEITAQTRMRLLRTLFERDIAPVALFTDAILTEDRSLPTQQCLGGWDLEKRGEAIILGAGVYSIRTDNETDTCLRGFVHKSERSLFDILTENPTSTHIRFNLNRPVTLGEYIAHCNKYVDGDFNEWYHRSRDLSINFDTKRIWAGDLASCADALRTVQDSTPLVI